MLTEKILVTGATGCLGSNLVRHLIAGGADVAILKRHEESLGPLAGSRRSFQVVVVNPSAVIAPGGSLRYGWAAVIEAIRRGRMPVYPGGGSAFCSRRDLVDGLTRAMRSGKHGQRYILSSENLSYRDLAHQI